MEEEEEIGIGNIMIPRCSNCYFFLKDNAILGDYGYCKDPENPWQIKSARFLCMNWTWRFNKECIRQQRQGRQV